MFEAIDVDGLRERAVIATKASSTIVPEMVASDPEASVVLVLDPATESDIAAVQPFIAAAEGRLVVIAVQERDGAGPAHAGHLIVPPLDGGAIRRLINPENDPTKADEGLVALAGGYPGLALQIGEVIRRREPGAELLSVARDPDVRGRLSRLVPDKVGREALAALAPFGRVGFSGEAKRELTILTKALELDDLVVSAQLDRYEGRLLTRSGDYRRVSPDIVAAWLSEEAFETFGRRVVEAAGIVPERLAVSLLDRLATMPGSQAAVRIATELAQLDRFKSTTMADLDVVRGRMLIALAVLAPTVGLEHLMVPLASEGGATPGRLPPDLLSAIEELLWVHETHEPALQLLFELARADGSTNTVGNGDIEHEQHDEDERERGRGTDPGRGVDVGPAAICRVVPAFIAHAGAVGRSTHRPVTEGASGRGRCPWPRRRERPRQARPRSSGRPGVDGADVPGGGTRESVWFGPARRHALSVGPDCPDFYLADWAMFLTGRWANRRVSTKQQRIAASGPAGPTPEENLSMAKSRKPSAARKPPEPSDSHAEIEDWTRSVMPDLQPIVKRLDEMIRESIPGLHYAIKWKKAYYGVPELGWIIEMVAYDVSVNVVFFGGAEFDSPPPLGDTDRSRYIKVSSVEDVQRREMRDWIEQAGRVPGWS